MLTLTGADEVDVNSGGRAWLRPASRPIPLLLITVIAGAAVALGYRWLNGASLDGPYFTHAADRLLGAGGLHVYADSGLQAGPWELLAFAALRSGAVFAAVSGAVTAAALVFSARGLAEIDGRRLRAGVAPALLALAAGWGVVSSVYSGGHPAELVIPMAWGLAGACALRSRAVEAGLILGLATGWETWALLGLPLLLLSRGNRRAALSAIVAIAAAAATYLPFLAAGPFRMGKVTWSISSQSLVAALGVHGQFTWGDRLVQSGFVFALGLGAVLAARRARIAPSPALWLCPAVIAVAKVVTDPAPRDYYWLPLQALLLVGFASSNRALLTRAAWMAPALVVSLIAPLQMPALEVLSLVCALIAVVPRPGSRRATAPALAADGGLRLAEQRERLVR